MGEEAFSNPVCSKDLLLACLGGQRTLGASERAGQRPAAISRQGSAEGGGAGSGYSSEVEWMGLVIAWLLR